MAVEELERGLATDPVRVGRDGPTRVRHLVLLAACSVAVIAYIHRVGFARALPNFNLDSAESSWLTAIFLLAYGAFEVPCGVLGDRLGSRHLLTVLVLGWSLVTGCVALAVYFPELWVLPVLLVLRFLFGLFQAGGFPVLSRLLTDWMPKQERASAQGYVWMSSRLGGMVVPLVLGWLTLALGNWQMALVIIAASGAIWCSVFWPWFRNRPEEMPGVNDAELRLIARDSCPRSEGHGTVPWKKLLRSRNVWALCLMYSGVGFAANFYTTLLPFYLKQERRLGEGETDWLSSLPFACGMAACLAGGLFSDWLIRQGCSRKWGRRINGIIGLTLGAIGWLALNWLDGPWALALVLCFIFICNDLNMAPAWASCADIGESYAGTIGGAMNMLGAWAGAVGNLVAGHLFARGHADWVFVLYAASFLLAAMCWFAVDVSTPVRSNAGTT